MFERKFRCSFCRQTSENRRFIIANTINDGGGICEVCVATCIQLIAEEFNIGKSDFIAESLKLEEAEGQQISPEEKLKTKQELIDLFDGFLAKD